MRSPHTMRTPTLRAALGALAVLPALLLAACDAAGPAPPDGPDPLPPLPAESQALVVEAFQDVEALFSLGTGASARAAASVCCGSEDGPAPDNAQSWRVWLAQFSDPPGSGDPPAAARFAPDTTLYTGVYDAGNAKGYLATLSYREPQGVGVWSARFQHARAVDHDDDGGTPAVDAVETVDLTFLTHADLAGFLTAIEGGTIASHRYSREELGYFQHPYPEDSIGKAVVLVLTKVNFGDWTNSVEGGIFFWFYASHR